MASMHHPADEAVHQLAAEVLKQYEPDLHQAGLTFQIVFVHGDNGEPVLKHGGYPAAGKIKRNSQAERAKGLPDVTIILDAAEWLNANRRKQQALLAHEFHHVMLTYTKPTKKNPEIKVKLDSDGRPKLALRKHDYQIGIFTEIVKDFGEDSFDYDQAEHFGKYVQTLIKWG